MPGKKEIRDGKGSLPQAPRKIPMPPVKPPKQNK